jgi:hypothetical protein
LGDISNPILLSDSSLEQSEMRTSETSISSVLVASISHFMMILDSMYDHGILEKISKKPSFLYDLLLHFLVIVGKCQWI